MIRSHLPALAMALACTLLAACATAPAPLQGSYAAVSPDQATTSASSTGTAVRWGGRIVEVTPQADRTCFQMLSAPLDGNGRPSFSGNRTGGRFIACRAGFYDPALFAADREVTFTGRIAATEQVRIGEYDYRLPRMDADVVYLWPERADVQVIRYEPYPWGWGPGWWW
ncbi:hypothetical protein CO641_02775 [Lysobacteraceae bacterium NML91-0213]|nr:hypothetical protein CO641_02775 [Xanthomonadaceae bacterium NML91-0213]